MPELAALAEYEMIDKVRRTWPKSVESYWDVGSKRSFSLIPKWSVQASRNSIKFFSRWNYLQKLPSLNVFNRKLMLTEIITLGIGLLEITLLESMQCGLSLRARAHKRTPSLSTWAKSNGWACTVLTGWFGVRISMRVSQAAHSRHKRRSSPSFPSAMTNP